MTRLILASLAVTVLIAVAPGSPQAAQTMNCDDIMADAELMMNSMTDPIKKRSVMSEINMADASMGMNDEKSCLMHMRIVRNMIMMK